jgi:hypothetical protein
MKAPKNTAASTAGDALGTFLAAQALGPTSFVEDQEARGQRSFVSSDTLPSDMGRRINASDPDPREVLEAAGVVFHGVVAGDPMFTYVELPAGWKKEPTDHSMWSRLVDEKGRERASIFYKAAFYDRRAHLRLSTRFCAEYDYERERAANEIVAMAKDGSAIVFATPPVAVTGDREADRVAGDTARAAAVAWLDENYPDWQNPAAYWKEP